MRWKILGLELPSEEKNTHTLYVGDHRLGASHTFTDIHQESDNRRKVLYFSSVETLSGDIPGSCEDVSNK